MDVAHQAERMSGCGKHYPILSDWNWRLAAIRPMSALGRKRTFGDAFRLAESGPLLIRHTDQAARSLWPTSLLRHRGSC